ncbi:hypothetical protein L598_001200000170 [Mesorhizobium sp. J18]|uniref:hypothetical protein n=1 Tax=Mesorhizobium sp. J18 TaxID=935263 RepID=UPI0011994467|nr:hypothetical protein [Mesorhizobium sp. J18]TWG99885.1 hypothetical protein L598_001200000170 [Mesorhizobium sp. J18]
MKYNLSTHDHALTFAHSGLSGQGLLVQIDTVTEVENDPSSGAIEISGMTGQDRCKVRIPTSALGEILQASIRAEESGYLLEDDFQVEMPMLVPESVTIEAAKDMGLVFRFHLHDGRQAAFIIPTGIQFEQLDKAARTVSEGIQMADDGVTADCGSEPGPALV